MLARRSRAGNAMARARVGILEGARAALVDGGIKAVTMSGVADRGGVAKATVYNHFRTTQDVLAAVAMAEIDDAAEAAWPWLTRDLAQALVTAVQTLASSSVVRAVIEHDPAVAATVFPVQTGPGGPCRDHAAALVADALATAERIASAVNVDLVLRWIAAVAVSPPDDDLLRAQAQLVVATLRG